MKLFCCLIQYLFHPFGFNDLYRKKRTFVTTSIADYKNNKLVVFSAGGLWVGFLVKISFFCTAMFICLFCKPNLNNEHAIHSDLYSSFKIFLFVIFICMLRFFIRTHQLYFGTLVYFLFEFSSMKCFFFLIYVDVQTVDNDFIIS